MDDGNVLYASQQDELVDSSMDDGNPLLFYRQPLCSIPLWTMETVAVAGLLASIVFNSSG